MKNVTLLLSDWWGSGIVHAKVWISDGKDIYIGSANNDWKSLTQVLCCIHSIKAPFNQYFIFFEVITERECMLMEVARRENRFCASGFSCLHCPNSEPKEWK